MKMREIDGVSIPEKSLAAAWKHVELAQGRGPARRTVAIVESGRQWQHDEPLDGSNTSGREWYMGPYWTKPEREAPSFLRDWIDAAVRNGWTILFPR